ncbi:hypothetical protein ONZ43_g4984 [Nemania bipapillata]|uniref:Uncharacterized protein n=1 Tax=Nemania bipapillata TaxID=110536 RepID=A0ACC2IG27_9PEZI|nr:hypothetical protein ONZ43_g4984 [Nemania bipapillata]
MNNVNMSNMPMAGGPVVGGAMAMMGGNGLATGQVQRPPENNRANLNTYIYDYFLRERMFDCARAMLNSEQALNVHKSPRRDENGNAIGNGLGDDPMDTDSKDDLDSKRPSDLPAPNVPNGSDSCFLYEWFCLFWDILSAQRNKGGVNPQVSQYVNHTQHQNRLRHNQSQQEIMRQIRPDMYNPMMQRIPNGMPMNAKHPNLARTAMANNQNNPQMQMLQAAKQNQMQRDGSNMDGNQNRAASPGSAENAPSPSKRARLEGAAPFNGQHANMMNGQRPQQGIPGQQVGETTAAAIAQQMLSSNGISPANLAPQQFRDFQSQPTQAQAKSIQTYSQNLQQHHGQQMPNKQVPNPGGPQGQGSPMMPQGPDNAPLGPFYSEMAPGAMRAGPGAAQGSGSNHALQDYQMQLMLLEQQNKKRLMMARQEHDSLGGIRDGTGPNGPGGPPGPNGQPFPDTSPQGVRPGASPNPNEQIKRGTPQLNPAGIPSPLPEGAQSRGSPNTLNFMPNGIDPNMQPGFFKGMNGMDSNMVAAQMNGAMRPPSSHPNPPFAGQMTPQMMARQQAGPQQMPWQGPNGNNMGPQVPQGPQVPVQGTPSQRMPPPQAPAPTANGNGRTSTSSPQTSTAAPPTPQQSTKAPPKKKDTKGAKSKAAAQKNKAPPAGATPAPEANQDQEPPTPATPITPNNLPNFKSGQNAPVIPPVANAPASAPQATPQVVAPQVEQMNFLNDNNNPIFSTTISDFNELTAPDVLQDFDFDSFLQDGEGDNGPFDFNAASFGMDTAPNEIES